MSAAAHSTKVKVKVVPGAATTEVVGWLGDTLKVRVTAPPEKGKANAAVETAVAKALEISISSVRIVVGKKSSRKTIEILGLSNEAVKQKISISGES
jgi:hypothetical protein